MDCVYWIRVLNSVLAAAVFGLCLSKGFRPRMGIARNARVLGLAFIAATVAWGSQARQGEPLTPRTIMLTIGLSLCCYGMARNAPGELKPPKSTQEES